MSVLESIPYKWVREAAQKFVSDYLKHQRVFPLELPEGDPAREMLYTAFAEGARAAYNRIQSSLSDE